MTYPLERDYHFLQNEFFPVFLSVYLHLCLSLPVQFISYEEMSFKKRGGVIPYIIYMQPFFCCIFVENLKLFSA